MQAGSSAIIWPSITRHYLAWRHRRHYSSPLPLYNQLRLIEEVCMLDQLSGGRLELGVGRGVTPCELRYYGVDPAGTRAIFNEALTVLVSG